MRKLIEISQEYLITCDNPKCDYKILNDTGDHHTDASHFVGIGCPKCGDNLLTEEDHINAIKVLKVVDWMNKWFSWLTIFYSKNTKTDTVSVHCYDGINVKKEKA